jgi:hypothetical protein
VCEQPEISPPQNAKKEERIETIENKTKEQIKIIQNKIKIIAYVSSPRARLRLNWRRVRVLLTN